MPKTPPETELPQKQFGPQSGPLWEIELDRAINRRFSQMVTVRRRLHAQPEVSGDERRTSLYLYQLLGDEGFPVSMGVDGRGVFTDFRSKNPTGQSTSQSTSNSVGNSVGNSVRNSVGEDAARRELLALRADIDALHIHDAKQVDYRSRVEGVMHACGHDGHTALVFGALTALHDLSKKDLLPWPIAIRGIFQPAEETCCGAKEMISVGALENVAGIVAAHMDPSRRIGQVGLRAGVLTANCDEMIINVIGRGGHAARPHETQDPIAATAQFISSLYQFIPRVTDSQDAVVVTIGRIQGGDTANVIPEGVELRGTVRTLDANVRQRTFEHIRRLARGVGQTTDTQILVEFGVGSASVRNDPALIGLMDRAARRVLGPHGVQEIPRPSMGSEDFSFYLEHTPGAMMRLGCVSEKAGGAPLHSPEFDFDEESLRIGARTLARTAVYWWERR